MYLWVFVKKTAAVHANDKSALKIVKQFVTIEAYVTGYFCVCFLS